VGEFWITDTRFAESEAKARAAELLRQWNARQLEFLKFQLSAPTSTPTLGTKPPGQPQHL
jgi:hypothetical protein